MLKECVRVCCIYPSMPSMPLAECYSPLSFPPPQSVRSYRESAFDSSSCISAYHLFPLLQPLATCACSARCSHQVGCIVQLQRNNGLIVYSSRRCPRRQRCAKLRDHKDSHHHRQAHTSTKQWRHRHPPTQVSSKDPASQLDAQTSQV